MRYLRQAVRKALGKAVEDHKRRNLVSEWALDLSYLKEIVGK